MHVFTVTDTNNQPLAFCAHRVFFDMGECMSALEQVTSVLEFTSSAVLVGDKPKCNAYFELATATGTVRIWNIILEEL